MQALVPTSHSQTPGTQVRSARTSARLHLLLATKQQGLPPQKGHRRPAILCQTTKPILPDPCRGLPTRPREGTGWATAGPCAEGSHDQRWGQAVGAGHGSAWALPETPSFTPQVAVSSKESHLQTGPSAAGAHTLHSCCRDRREDMCSPTGVSPRTRDPQWVLSAQGHPSSHGTLKATFCLKSRQHTACHPFSPEPGRALPSV